MPMGGFRSGSSLRAANENMKDVQHLSGDTRALGHDILHDSWLGLSHP